MSYYKHFWTTNLDGWEIVLVLGFRVQIAGVVAGKISVFATVFVETFNIVAISTLRIVVLSEAEIVQPVSICFCLAVATIWVVALAVTVVHPVKPSVQNGKAH